MLNRLIHLLQFPVDADGAPKSDRCRLLDPALPSWQRQEIRIPGQNLLRLWREGDADLLPGERISVHRYLPQSEAEPFWHAHPQPIAVITARCYEASPQPLNTYTLRVGAQNLTGGFIKDLAVLSNSTCLAYEHTNPMSAHAVTVKGTWYSVMLTYTGTDQDYAGLTWPKADFALRESFAYLRVRNFGRQLFDTLEEGL